MTGWKIEELDFEPVELESDGTPNGLIQRRNIKKVKKSGDKPAHYECEMRFITVSEYELLKAIQNIMNGGVEV